MHYHFKGSCVTCQEDVEFLSVEPYQRECVNCQFFNKNGKTPKRRFSTQAEFWEFFRGWPDRRLDPRESLHARSVFQPLSVSPEGLGEWLEI